MKKTYRDYFVVKLGDRDKLFAPHLCCKTCVENLKDRRNGKRKSMSFAILMVWRKGKDHITDCYFCMINLKGIFCKNKHHVQYSEVPSAIRPISDGLHLPVPKPDGNMEYSSDSKYSEMTARMRSFSTCDIFSTPCIFGLHHIQPSLAS